MNRLPIYSLEDAEKYIHKICGLSVSLNYDFELYRLHISVTSGKEKFSFGKIECVIDFPRVRKAMSYCNTNSFGYVVESKSGVIRFHRAYLRNYKCHPIYDFFEDSITENRTGLLDDIKFFLGESCDNFYYISEWFADVAERIVSAIDKTCKNAGILSAESYFEKEIKESVSKLVLQECELIQNETGELVMGQEVVIGCPELKDYKPGFSNKFAALIKEMFQKYAYKNDFSLLATKKSHPGDIVTQVISVGENRDTLLNLLLNIPTVRACRAFREQRGIRAAEEFLNPSAKSFYQRKFELPDFMNKYLNEITVAYIDTPHGLPLFTDGEWTPDTSANQDRIIITPTGQEKLRVSVKVSKVLSEEEWCRTMDYLCEKDNFVLHSEEIVLIEGLYVKQYHVSWTENEETVQSAKVVFPSGVKGITEPVDTQFFWSYFGELNDSILTLDSLLKNKLIVPVDALVAASSILSKQAYSMLITSVLTRYPDEMTGVIQMPLLNPYDIISPERTDALKSKGTVTENHDDFVESIGRIIKKYDKVANEDGTVFIYTRRDSDRIQLLKDKEGNPVQVVAGPHVCWRTSQKDQPYSWVNTFGPNREDSVRTRGSQIDFHTAKLGNIDMSTVSDIGRKHINSLAQSIKKVSDAIERER